MEPESPILSRAPRTTLSGQLSPSDDRYAPDSAQWKNHLQELQKHRVRGLL